MKKPEVAQRCRRNIFFGFVSRLVQTLIADVFERNVLRRGIGKRTVDDIDGFARDVRDGRLAPTHASGVETDFGVERQLEIEQETCVEMDAAVGVFEVFENGIVAGLGGDAIFAVGLRGDVFHQGQAEPDADADRLRICRARTCAGGDEDHRAD